jgi:hypothetical protein
MPRLALLNMLIGFAVLFLAAAAGAFLASDITTGFLRSKAFLDTWGMVLTKSSHGHTNLFALIHIAFGLTMPYSTLSLRLKKAQTVGLLLGTLAMGPGMLVRATMPPSEGIDVVAYVIGVGLSCALAAMFAHAAGLGAKLLARG